MTDVEGDGLIDEKVFYPEGTKLKSINKNSNTYLNSDQRFNKIYPKNILSLGGYLVDYNTDEKKNRNLSSRIYVFTKFNYDIYKLPFLQQSEIMIVEYYLNPVYEIHDKKENKDKKIVNYNLQTNQPTKSEGSKICERVKDQIDNFVCNN